MYAGDFPQDLSNPRHRACPCLYRLVCFHSRPAECKRVGGQRVKKLKEKYCCSPKLPFWPVSSSIFSEITPLCFVLSLSSLAHSSPDLLFFFPLHSSSPSSLSPSVPPLPLPIPLSFLNPSCPSQLPAGLFLPSFSVAYFFLYSSQTVCEMRGFGLPA